MYIVNDSFLTGWLDQCKYCYVVAIKPKEYDDDEKQKKVSQNFGDGGGHASIDLNPEQGSTSQLDHVLMQMFCVILDSNLTHV